MEKQFQRTESILGAESTSRLAECRILLFGLGGVGGYVCEALARSGVGTLDIVDADVVDETNINRQIIATHKSIGIPKVDLWESRINDISPNAAVNKYRGFYLPQNSKAASNNTSDILNSDTDNSKKYADDSFISGNDFNNAPFLSEFDFDFEKYDYIIDAIDTVAAKIDIIRIAKEKDIPMISAMGCGNRIDPTLLICTDIYKTHTDPLAKVMRKELTALGIKGLDVVYSTERPMRPALPKSDTDELASQENSNGKRTPPGSTPFVPAAAGLLIASVVVRKLLDME